MSDFSQSIVRIAVFAIPFLLGVICHEVAHGLVANRLGDPTARDAGRLTLNPVRHLDPMGTAMFVLTSMLPGVVFGWAKPVPVNPARFKNPARDMALVAAAGPLTNFALAGVFYGLFLLIGQSASMGGGFVLSYFGTPLISIAIAGVFVNLILGVLNLIPIPPLDGSKIVAWLLPPKMAWQYLRFGRYGLLLLILLLASGALDVVFRPVIIMAQKLVGF